MKTAAWGETENAMKADDFLDVAFAVELKALVARGAA